MTNIIIDSIAYYVPELYDMFSIWEHQCHCVTMCNYPVYFYFQLLCLSERVCAPECSGSRRQKNLLTSIVRRQSHTSQCGCLEPNLQPYKSSQDLFLTSDTSLALRDIFKFLL